MSKKIIKNNNKYYLIASIIVVLGLLTLIFRKQIFEKKHEVKRIENKFTKEGELTFADSTGKEIKKIDIEFSDNDYDTELGLMYRYSMEEYQGMLFIFPVSKPHSFWMRNTYISLDIIFVKSDLSILNIQKYAPILNDNPLPSDGDAQYVVEVIAGFSDKYNLKPGDKISYKDLRNK